MLNLISKDNLTFTKQHCNCGLSTKNSKNSKSKKNNKLNKYKRKSKTRKYKI